MIKRLANHFFYYVTFYTRALNVSLQECDTIANKFKWLVVSQPFELQGYSNTSLENDVYLQFSVKEYDSPFKVQDPYYFLTSQFQE